MKYLLMIHTKPGSWAAYSSEEVEKGIAAQNAFNNELFATGELVGAYGLGEADAAKVVRVRAGEPTVTDGPYLEAKEYLASYCLVDVANEARALELAAKMPYAEVAGVEVWPIAHEATPPQRG
ncbi:MAG TPA: YciI family protein [Pseudonocardiaceae bacterium]|jgi:hypothetical protein|nr:YciI family protein [Pseudonocardiaceae bacterium]